MKKKTLPMLSLGLSLLLTGGCAHADPMASGPHEPVQLSAWIASWDQESGAREYKKLKKRLDSMSCFMAYYGNNDKLILSDGLRASAALAEKEGQKKRYLSFTNDLTDAKGKTVTKDAELMRRLLAGNEKKEETLRQMIDAAKELKCTGIELDYEAFWKDKELLQDYLDFTYRLSAVCLNENLALRIVLEPGMPMDAGLCKGPEYVVMCYNLYGKHSGPGPKADREFIAKTLKKMEAIPGKKGIAFATGGCLWEDYGLLGLKKGPVRFIDEDEAADLAKGHKVAPERDEDSAALHFTFTEDGHSREVWYADSETLNAWIKEAADAGIENVSLWRLGSNTDIEEVKTR